VGCKFNCYTNLPKNFESNLASYDCPVCAETVTEWLPLWSCKNCYQVYHYQCIGNWAITNATTSSETDIWDCPTCKNPNIYFPAKDCWCGKSGYRSLPADTNSCARYCQRAVNCKHNRNPQSESCMYRCHPGPCPPSKCGKKCQKEEKKAAKVKVNALPREVEPAQTQDNNTTDPTPKASGNSSAFRQLTGFFARLLNTHSERRHLAEKTYVLLGLLIIVNGLLLFWISDRIARWASPLSHTKFVQSKFRNHEIGLVIVVCILVTPFNGVFGLACAMRSRKLINDWVRERVGPDDYSVVRGVGNLIHILSYVATWGLMFFGPVIVIPML
jgi:hypothetical protein